MATRHKQLLLPTSSGLVDEALRQRKKIQREKSLWNPLADSVGSTASYISPQIRLLSSLRGVKSGREDATSLSRLRLICNKMESTAEICSSFLPRSDQSGAEYVANGQSPKRQPDAFTAVARLVTSITDPPPLLPFVGARGISWEKWENNRKRPLSNTKNSLFSS